MTNMIYTQLATLPHTLPGCVRSMPDGSYLILLNDRMTRERNVQTYAHELFHINNGDFDSADSASNIEHTAHGGDHHGIGA